MKDLENTRDYEIESANGIKIRGVLEEKGEKVKITLFGKLDVPEDTTQPRTLVSYKSPGFLYNFMPTFLSAIFLLFKL